MNLTARHDYHLYIHKDNADLEFLSSTKYYSSMCNCKGKKLVLKLFMKINANKIKGVRKKLLIKN